MNLKSKSILAAKWTSLNSIVNAIASIIKISVLTRFLNKEDFGLMAIVNVVLGFMALFIDMGLTSAIIHKQKINKNEYSSLYFLNIFFSLILITLILISRNKISEFYNQNELVRILSLMSCVLFLSALGQQFKTVKEKNLQFKFISIVEIFSVFTSLFFAIYLSFNEYGVYSLVYSALLQFTLTNFTYLIFGLKSNPLKMHFNFYETIPFLKIGIYNVGGQFINYINRDLDTLIIGKLLGAEILGTYSLAKQLVFRPESLINPILNKVAAPILSKIQSNKETLKISFLKLLDVSSTLNLIAYLSLAIFAYPIVRILYGSAFIQIVPVVQILCIYMYLRSLGNPVKSLVTATGKTNLEFYWNFYSLLIAPFFILLGSTYGIMGISISLTFFSLLTVYPFYKLMVNKMINVSFIEYLSYMPVKKINFINVK